MSEQSNHGKPWTVRDNYYLAGMYVKSNRTVEFIANRLGRTEKAIEAQLCRLGLASVAYTVSGSGPSRYELLPRGSQQATRIFEMHEKAHKEQSNKEQTVEVVACKNTDTLVGTMPNIVVMDDIQENTMKFYEIKHYIAGIEASKISNEELIAIISKEAAEIEALSKIKPLPKRVMKEIEERRAELAAAVEYLDSLEA